MSQTSHIKNKLKDAKLKVTPNRLAIMEVLGSAEEPLAISQIQKHLSLEQIHPNSTTVYRTIEILFQHHLIHRVDFGEGSYRYELAGDHHHHLVCDTCKGITPVFDECVVLSDQAITQKYGFEVSRHQLEFFGKCKTCRKKTTHNTKKHQ